MLRKLEVATGTFWCVRTRLRLRSLWRRICHPHSKANQFLRILLAMMSTCINQIPKSKLQILGRLLLRSTFRLRNTCCSLWRLMSKCIWLQWQIVEAKKMGQKDGNGSICATTAETTQTPQLIFSYQNKLKTTSYCELWERLQIVAMMKMRRPPETNFQNETLCVLFGWFDRL